MSSDKIASTDVETIKKLIDMMSENDLVEVELTDEKTKVHLRRPEPKQPEQIITQMPAMAPMQAMPATAGGVAPVAAPVADAAAVDEANTIDSPIVGTFYTAPSPDSDPFVKVGDSVTEDTVVCIVEAMKVMNEIKAEASGTISEICVSNGEAVEFGQPLFKIK
ncbi:MAG: acetyl-CoA carboxylase biotin carboxyl carrier protein [Sedimentisphaeraceae bacterium JB056]